MSDTHNKLHYGKSKISEKYWT